MASRQWDIPGAGLIAAMVGNGLKNSSFCLCAPRDKVLWGVVRTATYALQTKDNSSVVVQFESGGRFQLEKDFSLRSK
jgi:hypothetical protein